MKHFSEVGSLFPNGASPIDESLKRDLHQLRKYRKRWVHVEDPWNDDEFLEDIDEKTRQLEIEVEQMAFVAVRALRRTIYENPWI